MKKYIIIFAILAAALSSCTRAAVFEQYNQDTTLYRTGDVTLLCSIEDFSSKATVDANGHGLWKKNDTILVFTTKGTAVKFALDGTGDTKRAIFKGTIPPGETLGTAAMYPADAFVSYSGDKLVVKTPAEYEKEDDRFYGVMVASIADSFEICFQQLFSYVNFVITSFPANASTLVLEEQGRSIAGEFIVDPATVATTGITASKGSSTIAVHLDKAQTSFTRMLPLPVATYKELSAKALDAEGKELTSTPVLMTSLDLSRGALKSVACEMPKVVIDGTILLNGVYWAKGNLLRDASASAEEGFREGWKLTDEQWYNVGYDLKVSTTSTGTYRYDGSNGSDFRYNVNQNLCDHFNFGGIKKDAGYIFDSYDRSDVMNNNATFSICGKMYTDANGVNATDDFEAAKFGDIAYWASNGQYRMPTTEEFTALKACDYICGHYTEPVSGMKIWGILFTEPVVPGVPNHVYGDAELTAQQLEQGLFLPLCGRHTDSNVMVIQYRQYGFYWTGDAVAKSETTMTNGDEYQYAWTMYLYNNGTEIKNCRGAAFDRRAGFSIRPVLMLN